MKKTEKQKFENLIDAYQNKKAIVANMFETNLFFSKLGNIHLKKIDANILEFMLKKNLINWERSFYNQTILKRTVNLDIYKPLIAKFLSPLFIYKICKNSDLNKELESQKYLYDKLIKINPAAEKILQSPDIKKLFPQLFFSPNCLDEIGCTAKEGIIFEVKIPRKILEQIGFLSLMEIKKIEKIIPNCFINSDKENNIHFNVILSNVDKAFSFEKLLKDFLLLDSYGRTTANYLKLVSKHTLDQKLFSTTTVNQGKVNKI